jgi:hypothetical protein
MTDLWVGMQNWPISSCWVQNLARLLDDSICLRKARDRHSSELAGSAQDTSDNLIQGRARSQQVLGLEGPDSDLDEGAPGWNEAQGSRHVRVKTENRSPMSST